MTQRTEETVGARIRRFRTDLGMSLSDVAERAEVAKGYLSVLENEESDAARRPSGATLLRVAAALGVTIADLIGEAPTSAGPALPPGLREFAEANDLPEADVHMLAQIEFRGRRPNSPEAWQFIYQAIRRSV